MRQVTLSTCITIAVLGCGEPLPPPATTLADGAPFEVEVVYVSDLYSDFSVSNRPWIPMDLDFSPDGQLWVVQRLERGAGFDDDSECTSRSASGGPNDCGGLQGGTVTIDSPFAAEPATRDNGRAHLVVDYNAWHFMRRPAGIAFADLPVTLTADDPGARDPMTGALLVDGSLTFTDVFATCHEHWTGNYTDEGSFMGPTLWTGQRDIYNGGNGSQAWSNGSHLDMVHATEYCVGIAHEVDSVYWIFNGAEGALDRYDFGAPHFPGHSNHDDGEVRRYTFAQPLSRVPDVPSNLLVIGTDLYVADTGNGRVVRFDTTSALNPGPTFYTFDNLLAETSVDMSLTEVASAATLTEAFGGTPRPSGLGVLQGLLVVGDHASGRIALIDLEDDTVVRTLDTGLGAGLGGITVRDDRVYFTNLVTRSVYRIDVVAE